MHVCFFFIFYFSEKYEKFDFLDKRDFSGSTKGLILGQLG